MHKTTVQIRSTPTLFFTGNTFKIIFLFILFFNLTTIVKNWGIQSYTTWITAFISNLVSQILIFYFIISSVLLPVGFLKCTPFSTLLQVFYQVNN